MKYFILFVRISYETIIFLYCKRLVGNTSENQVIIYKRRFYLSYRRHLKNKIFISISVESVLYHPVYWLEAFSIAGTELICKLLYKHLIDGLFKCRSSQGKVLPDQGVIPGVSSIPTGTDRRSCNSPACQIPADFDASGTRLCALTSEIPGMQYLPYNIYMKKNDQSC